MRISALTCLLLGSHLIAEAHLTHKGMRNLTALTDDLRGQLGDAGVEGVKLRGGGTQRVLRVGEGEEAEITVTAALRMLCSDTLKELERKPPKAPDEKKPDCSVVVDEYHSFIGATVKFLRDVRENQTRWRWDTESPVFENVAWMQALWASRSANKQKRSFIEQMMELYEYREKEGCFGKDDEVLRRDVEIVEFLNDLLDEF